VTKAVIDEQRLCLRETPARQGWTAAVLECAYPVPPKSEQSYVTAVAELLGRLPAFSQPRPSELFLQWDRCRPDREVMILRENARVWQPEIGLGVWLDREPPTMWSPEEFVAAAPGTLRPLMHHLFRLQRDAKVQESAWRRLRGSGVLLRVVCVVPDAFVAGATEFLHPRITETSLTGFPFYGPLLTVDALSQPNAVFDGPIDLWLPAVQGYLRESEEDGGLLVVARQSSSDFWQSLGKDDFGIDGVPLPARDGDAAS
jgi:hypothetical protein